MKQDRIKIDARSSTDIARALLKTMMEYEKKIDLKAVKSRAEKRHVTFLSLFRESK
jgi:hypothetical protein